MQTIAAQSLHTIVVSKNDVSPYDPVFASPRAYAGHQDVPVRIRVAHDGGPLTVWQTTATGAVLLEELALRGLSERDILVNAAPDCLRIITDNGGVRLSPGGVDVDQLEQLRAMLGQIAAGVARYRMLRRSGWDRQQTYPRWSITASKTLDRLLQAAGFSAEDLWSVARIWNDDEIRTDVFHGTPDAYPATDVRHALPPGYEVARHETGLSLNCEEDGLEYSEYGRAHVMLDRSRLITASLDVLVGQRVDQIVGGRSALLALIGDRIVTGIAASVGTSELKLNLGAKDTTLAPIPAAVLADAGVDCPSRANADHPWWIVTPPALIKSTAASAGGVR